MVPHPRREVELTSDFGLDLRGHLLATVYHVPLVHRQHQADRGLERVPGDVRVLRGDALGPVRQEDRDVGSFERVRRSQQRVVLDALLDTPTPADTRGIDKHQTTTTELDSRVEAVACRAGSLAHHRALAADQRVEEARLADVRPPDDRDVRIGRELLFLLRRETLYDDVEQIARSV